MEKKTTKIIETRVFDSYTEAQDMVNTAEQKRKQALIGLAISAVATLLSLIGLKLQDSSFGIICTNIGILSAIPAYLLGGGFGTALKTAWNLAKIGWIIVPFPFDIITGMLSFIFVLVAFCCAPVVFVGISFLKHERDYKEAQRYLSYFKAPSEKEATIE